MSRLIAVNSGTGRIGRSNLVLNAGISLARMDYNVLIVDGDLGMASLDILMGVMPNRSLEDVAVGKAEMEEIIIKTEHKVHLIAASSSMIDISSVEEERLSRLATELYELTKEYDFILVDTAAGFAEVMIPLYLSVSDILLGIHNDPSSLTDTYRIIKHLKKIGYKGRVSIFTGKVQDYNHGQALFKKLSSAAQRFLYTQIEYIGPVLHDARLQTAITEQLPVVVRFPSADISRCYRVIATTLLAQEPQIANLEQFWSGYIRIPRSAVPAQTVREIAFEMPAPRNDKPSLEKTMHAILDEQRNTRSLLERLITMMENPVSKGKR